MTLIHRYRFVIARIVCEFMNCVSCRLRLNYVNQVQLYFDFKPFNLSYTLISYEE